MRMLLPPPHLRLSVSPPHKIDIDPSTQDRQSLFEDSSILHSLLYLHSCRHHCPCIHHHGPGLTLRFLHKHPPLQRHTTTTFCMATLHQHISPSPRAQVDKSVCNILHDPTQTSMSCIISATGCLDRTSTNIKKMRSIRLPGLEFPALVEANFPGT